MYSSTSRFHFWIEIELKRFYFDCFEPVLLEIIESFKPEDDDFDLLFTKVGNNNIDSDQNLNKNVYFYGDHLDHGHLNEHE